MLTNHNWLRDRTLQKLIDKLANAKMKKKPLLILLKRKDDKMFQKQSGEPKKTCPFCQKMAAAKRTLLMRGLMLQDILLTVLGFR